MAEQDYVTFAAGANANTLTPAAYAQLPAVQTGFQAGQASSAQFNTFARQVSTVAAMIAQFISDTLAEDVIDNGNVAQLEQLFESALVKYANAPGAASLVHGGVDSGGTNALNVASAPTITALRPYLLLVTYPVSAAANATAQAPATVQTTDTSGQTVVRASLLRIDGSPVQAGDWYANQPLFMVCDGQNWRLIYSSPVPRYFGRATGTADAMSVATNPGFTTLLDGHVLDLATVGPNTTTSPTVNPNAQGTIPLLRQDGSAPVAGDISGSVSFLFDLPSRSYRLRSLAVSQAVGKPNPNNTQLSSNTNAALSLAMGSQNLTVGQDNVINWNTDVVPSTVGTYANGMLTFQLAGWYDVTVNVTVPGGSSHSVDTLRASITAKFTPGQGNPALQSTQARFNDPINPPNTNGAGSAAVQAVFSTGPIKVSTGDSLQIIVNPSNFYGDAVNVQASAISNVKVQFFNP